MQNKRIIASIQLDNQEVVKSYKFNERSYIGEPTNIIRIFNDKLVDELIITDISTNYCEPDIEFLSQLTSEAFMPLSYSGMVRNIDQVSRLFSIGFEKVIFNYSAIFNPKLINDSIKIFGGQSIVVCVDVLTNSMNYELFYRDKHLSQINIKDYIINISNMGVGEIVIQSVDKDGTQSGVNIGLLNEIKNLCKKPLVYCGGVKSNKDLKMVFDMGFSGCIVGSYFCQYGIHKAPLISYINIENVYEDM